MTTIEHKKKLTNESYDCAVYTISTSRYNLYGDAKYPENAEDKSGQIIINLLRENGHNIIDYKLLPDELKEIKNNIVMALNGNAEVIITTGGTGLTPSDVTIEAIEPLLEKEMPGFGELFRMKSINQIGTAIILTRALGGVANKKAIFCLPGSSKAVKLAIEEIILPEIEHIIKHIRGNI
ncbi:MAG: molybdenum cofactor biosynthesis protein B [Methanosarcinales archaeon]